MDAGYLDWIEDGVLWIHAGAELGSERENDRLFVWVSVFAEKSLGRNRGFHDGLAEISPERGG